jgi:hypothetical protein
MAFIIPAPLAAPAAVPAFGPSFQEAAPAPDMPQVGPGGQSYLPGVEQAPELYHIPCPNGHELETPPEMLEQDVMCPHCGAQFRLRQKDSVEFKRKRQEEQEKKDAKSGKFWLNMAIVFGVLILIFIVVLFAMQLGK